MLTYCLNEYPSAHGFENGLRPQLTFICKAEGNEAAIPRVMHKHDERFELMFILAGTGIYNIDGRGYNVKRGDLLLFNAGVLHDENPHTSDDLLIFSCGVEQLKFEGLPLNYLTTRSQAAVMPSGHLYGEIRGIFEQIWQQVMSKKRYGAEIAHHLLSVLLLLCRNIWLENNPEYSSADSLLGQKIKTYIDNHYKDEIALKSITAALNMNQFYLAHVFKAWSGYSPKQYQTRRRIGEAQSLLLSTDLGVTEVANAVGYDNVNNFHRIFHNLVGIPPARYKKFWLTGHIKS
ncbi:AraC family transcriptional regulator [Mixta theicola]|uniref:AraC family transcriptional regulator n=1 Tax=Mixta theicola TaxID=1458355 RepID=A0A2K1QAK3_9GAMM|nr:AraC family transcriptional regulator [Mixta theicola]PNS12055.1 AraC family transcriptional regulator [Mixta theicola]GLR10782.1 AraC family transcriptional regulator [Mixta theicola]